MTTPTRGDTDASSRVGALAALYASERQDGVNGLTAMLAVLAAAATYIAAVLAFGRSISQPSFWLIAPLPVWAAMSVQLMILGLGAVRAKSIFILEGQLVQCAGLSRQEHADIGYVASEQVMNPHLQPKPLLINSLFAHLLELIAIAAFTFYCGYQFVDNVRRAWLVVTPIVLGLCWVTVVVGAFARISKMFGTAYAYRVGLLP